MTKETTKAVLHAEIRSAVVPESNLFADSARGYRRLSEDLKHEVVNHAIGYVRGQAYTSGIENFWSLLKRGLKGTYVSVEPFHRLRYLGEQVFCFDQRGGSDSGGFKTVLAWVSELRLTYNERTGHEPEAAPT